MSLKYINNTELEGRTKETFTEIDKFCIHSIVLILSLKKNDIVCCVYQRFYDHPTLTKKTLRTELLSFCLAFNSQEYVSWFGEAIKHWLTMQRDNLFS